MIILDIETRPRPDLVERFIKPQGQFDPDSVKFGNTKDPEKRKALLLQKEQDFADEQSTYMLKAKSRAALNPLTAEIIVIGLHGDITEFLSGSESNILQSFWATFMNPSFATSRFCFWSGSSGSESFDPDMIIRRSWILNVPVPAMAFNGRYLGSRWEDAAQRYLFGKHMEYCGLSRAADELGLFVENPAIFPKDKENDRVTGENFHLWFDGKMQDVPETPTEQSLLAMKYLRNDLLILDAITSRIY